VFSNAEITAIILGVVGFLAGTVVAVLGFFLKRTVDSNDKAIGELKNDLKGAGDKRAEDIKEYQNKIDALRAQYDAKLEKHEEKIGERLDKHAEDVARGKSASHHDIDLESEKLWKEVTTVRERLTEALRQLEKDFLEFKGSVRGTYVSREDFIRESTQLESRIVATRRTLEGLDEVLKGYLKE
jgi:chromosome segregation ATPase